MPTTKPKPAGPHRIFPLAWLMARAFTKNKKSAVVAYPVSLLCVIPYGLVGGLYWNDPVISVQ